MIFKVFVVEDEPLLRREFIRMITVSSDKFQIVGQAEDGFTALQKIKRTHPDVVFTDIKMPVVSGLKLIENLHLEGLFPKTIIISGFDEFEFAKQAIRLGVSDYLVKPIVQKELSSVLKQVYWQLIDENRKKSKEEVLEYLKTGKIPSLNCRLWTSVVLRIGPSLESHEHLATRIPLNEKLEEVFSDCYYFILSEKDLDLRVVFGSDFSLKEKISELFNKLLPWKVSIVYSSAVDDIALLSSSLSKVSDCMNTAFELEKTKLIYAPEFHNKNKLEFFFEPVNNKNVIESFMKDSDSLISFCKNNNVSYVNFIQILQVNLISMLGEEVCCNKYKQAIASIFLSDSYAEITNGLGQFINELFKGKNKAPKEKAHEILVSRVNSFIEQNYSKDITLGQISNIVGYSPSYLSFLFKQRVGLSPMEYLQHLRIDKAVQLLNEPLLLKEISHMVGYKDPLYFSRVFKSIKGVSPMEYRKDCK